MVNDGDCKGPGPHGLSCGLCVLLSVLLGTAAQLPAKLTLIQPHLQTVSSPAQTHCWEGPVAQCLRQPGQQRRTDCLVECCLPFPALGKAWCHGVHLYITVSPDTGWGCQVSEPTQARHASRWPQVSKILRCRIS